MSGSLRKPMTTPRGNHPSTYLENEQRLAYRQISRNVPRSWRACTANGTYKPGWSESFESVWSWKSAHSRRLGGRSVQSPAPNELERRVGGRSPLFLCFARRGIDRYGVGATAFAGGASWNESKSAATAGAERCSFERPA